MTLLLRYCCYGAILITIPIGIISYNFDVDNVIVYENVAGSLEGTRSSYSGFSVALWNPGGNQGLEKSWLYIGSPRANSTSYQGIIERGAVWKCQIGQQCEEWAMDWQKDGLEAGSWLGGSLEIENTTQPNVVVCAPRALSYLKRQWLMTGRCYYIGARNLAMSSQVEKGLPLDLPFEKSKWDDKTSWTSYIGMAEVGFSSYFIPDNSHRIILGGPGMWDARGSLIRYSFEHKPQVIPGMTSHESAKLYDYLGYAVSSGLYYGGNGQIINAASAPRGANLLGRVILYTFPSISSGRIMNLESLKGSQAGEYFGSALASCDINGDGFDDLLVGAPHWTEKLDEGRVYVFHGSNSRLLDQISLDGKKPRGRFGTAVMCLGDVDYDNYADIAIGAPYEDHGVVYIYHGGAKGLRQTQIIRAPTNAKGFGISISKPKDIDNNHYVDIAVGAYLSGHVALYRSKQTVTASVMLSTPNLQEKPLAQDASSFVLKVCSSYSGKHAPKTLTVIKKLKIDENYQRARIVVNETNLETYEYNDTLKWGQLPSCQNFSITILTDNSNYLQPLTFSVIQRLFTTNRTSTLLVRKNNVSGTDSFDGASSVMNKLQSKTEDHIKVPFAVNCGKGDICRTHLNLQMVNNLMANKLVIDSVSYITINISIKNTGDHPAYLAQVILDIPSIIHVSQLPQLYGCEETTINSGKIKRVVCNAGNPLNNNVLKTLSYDLDVSSVKSNTETLRLNATAITQSEDDATGDHEQEMIINCVPEIDIGMIRKATVDRYSYTLKTEEEKLPNIKFQHVYDIKNYEVTQIKAAILSVSFPTHWIHSGNAIEIVRLHRWHGELEGREIVCDESEADGTLTGSDATVETEWLTGNNSFTKSGSKPDEKFAVIDGKVFASSPDNRTLYVNCSNPSIKWKSINCKLNTFRTTQSVARLTLTFDLLLANFTPEIIGKKYIIFFTSNGSVSIKEKPLETAHNEPNLFMIGTEFIENPLDDGLPAWVIPVAIFVGLLLLALIVLVLFKFGFFKRNKKMELRALLEEKNDVPVETATGSTMN